MVKVSATDPLQDTAEPIRGVCSNSAKTYVKKVRKHHTGRGEGKKKSLMDSRGNTRIWEGGGGAPWQRRYSPAAHGEDHTGAETHTAAWGGPHTGTVRYAPAWAEEKYEEERNSERNFYVLTKTPLHPCPKNDLEKVGKGVGSEGMNLRLGIRARKCDASMFVFLFPTVGKYLINNKLSDFSPTWFCFAYDDNSQAISFSVAWPARIFVPFLKFSPSQWRTWSSQWSSGSWPRLTNHAKLLTFSPGTLLIGLANCSFMK